MGRKYSAGYNNKIIRIKTAARLLACYCFYVLQSATRVGFTAGVTTTVVTAEKVTVTAIKHKQNNNYNPDPLVVIVTASSE